MQYLEHLARESARFAEALHDVPPDLRVPTCPDWTADDLLWHLAEVQWFWGTVVRDGVTGDEAKKLTPPRPSERHGLEAFYRQASRELQDVLAATPPEAPAWTWSSEQTAGFTRRRQTHEALIHRVDAELLAELLAEPLTGRRAGHRTVMDPQLSTDGVDEALRIMYGGVPPWGRFDPEPGKSLRIRAVDTGASWFVTLGRFSGTDPDDGKSYDEPDISPAENDSGEPAEATVSGRAEDLDCWLWHRPPVEPVVRAGAEDVLAEFETTIAGGIS